MVKIKKRHLEMPLAWLIPVSKKNNRDISVIGVNLSQK